jgi:hypothetical protein
MSMLVPMTVTAVACSIETPPTCSSSSTACSSDTVASSATGNSSSSISTAGIDDGKFVGCLETTFERYWGAKGALHNRQLLAHSITAIQWQDPTVKLCSLTLVMTLSYHVYRLVLTCYVVMLCIKLYSGLACHKLIDVQ